MNPLYPIEWAVAWLMVKFHALLSLFMEADSGITWVLSIVGLTAVVRTLIIPLFVRQIRASRAMQMVSPELQAQLENEKSKLTELQKTEARLEREHNGDHDKHDAAVKKLIDEGFDRSLIETVRGHGFRLRD